MTVLPENPNLRKVAWSGSVRRSPLWGGFDQASHATTGKPVIVCKLCKTLFSIQRGIILELPQWHPIKNAEVVRRKLEMIESLI